MELRKIAVDSAAEAYWADYFGDYGKQLTRTVLKRVAHLLITRTAAQVPGAQEAVVTLRPLAASRVGDELIIEGTAQIKLGRRAQLRCFNATLDAKGNVRHFDSVDIPQF